MIHLVSTPQRWKSVDKTVPKLSTDIEKKNDIPDKEVFEANALTSKLEKKNYLISHCKAVI